MKRLIIITLLLLTATVLVTVNYFKHLNPPGHKAEQVINSIPATAALIFEFGNDGSFYDIYNKSEIFTAITGSDKMRELHMLRKTLLNNEALRPFFADEDIYFSIHPQGNDSLAYLITVPSTKTIQSSLINQLNLKAIKVAGKTAYTIRVDSTQNDFYIGQTAGNIWMGSFSKPLFEASLGYKPQSQSTFALLTNQQMATALGSLYINYKQIGPLLNIFYKTDHIDMWKGISMLPATTALSLNYKSDALMFNGFTTFKKSTTTSYLDLFRNMKPVEMSLKNVLPITTAYSNSYAVDDVNKFENLLASWQKRAGIGQEKAALFSKIKAETGVQFDEEFYKLLDNEFALVTTRFQEKLAIIKVKNGAALRPFCNNISTMADDEIGQFNYNQAPLFLLGDAMAQLRRPYFIIIDNYLILANTRREISNYKENYFNNAFLNKGQEYAAFNNLLAQQCNVSFFIHFKNAGNVFKRSLKPVYSNIYQQKPGFRNYYAAAYQLAASENQFYTNLCVKLITPDSVSLNK